MGGTEVTMKHESLQSRDLATARPAESTSPTQYFSASSGATVAFPWQHASSRRDINININTNSGICMHVLNPLSESWQPAAYSSQESNSHFTSLEKTSREVRSRCLHHE